MVFDVDGAVFSLKADVHVTEVELSFEEYTFSFSDLALTFEFFTVTVLNLEFEGFFIVFGPAWVEDDIDFE